MYEIVNIKTSPAVRILCNVGQRRCQTVISKEGDTFQSASFKIMPEDNYFRLTVIDESGKRAWTNAYFTDEIYV